MSCASANRPSCKRLVVSRIKVGFDAAAQLRKDAKLSADRFGALNVRLFQIRDGIIQLMGEYRAEWRRRYNHE